jgi:hypothetical protein
MKTNQISQMTINDIQDSITLTAKLAKDNYDARNQIIDRLNSTVVVDPRSKASYIAGECSHYFPLHNQQGDKINEVKLYCRCSPTVKGSIRYSYSVNGKVVALKNVFLKLVDLGV